MITCPTYTELLENTVDYLKRCGVNEVSVKKVEAALPPAWQAEIVAEAIDQIEAHHV